MSNSERPAESVSKRWLRRTKNGMLFFIGPGVEVCAYRPIHEFVREMDENSDWSYLERDSIHTAVFCVPDKVRELLMQHADFTVLRRATMEPTLSSTGPSMEIVEMRNWREMAETSVTEVEREALLAGTIMMNESSTAPYWRPALEDKRAQAMLDDFLHQEKETIVAFIDTSRQCIRCWNLTKSAVAADIMTEIRSRLSAVMSQWQDQFFEADIKMLDDESSRHMFDLSQKCPHDDEKDRAGWLKARSNPLRFAIAQGASVLASYIINVPSKGMCAIHGSEEENPVFLVCGHIYCLECFTLRLEALPGPFKCIRCGRKPSIVEMKSILIRSQPAEYREVFQSFIDETIKDFIKGIPDCLDECPRDNCKCLFQTTRSTPVSATCFSCQLPFCSTCKLIHPPQQVDCDQDASRFDMLSGLRVLRCGGANGLCRSPLYKAGGCNNIQCPACKYNSCWLCGKAFSPEAWVDVYEHLKEKHNNFLFQDDEQLALIGGGDPDIPRRILDAMPEGARMALFGQRPRGMYPRAHRRRLRALDQAAAPVEEEEEAVAEANEEIEEKSDEEEEADEEANKETEEKTEEETTEGETVEGVIEKTGEEAETELKVEAETETEAEAKAEAEAEAEAGASNPPETGTIQE